MPGRSASSGGNPVKPLVRADSELRAFAAGWFATAAATLAAALALGIGEFSQAEVNATTFVLGLSVACALAGLVLGRRTGPAIAYRQLFETAPAAPRRRLAESGRRTVRRALTVAVASWAGFIAVAFFVLALTLLVMGQPREELLDHLPAASGLVAGGWMLVCAGVTRLIARWFARWQRMRGKVILCHPLRSGMLAHVYYVGDDPAGKSAR
jgi:MFS family permease